MATDKDWESGFCQGFASTSTRNGHNWSEMAWVARLLPEKHKTTIADDSKRCWPTYHKEYVEATIKKIRQVCHEQKLNDPVTLNFMKFTCYTLAIATIWSLVNGTEQHPPGIMNDCSSKRHVIN